MTENAPAIDWQNVLAAISVEQQELIGKIAQRAIDIVRQHGGTLTVDHMQCIMDICLVHSRACPLHLWRWLASAQADFVHDFHIICTMTDRTTGDLKPGKGWPIHAVNPRPHSFGTVFDTPQGTLRPH